MLLLAEYHFSHFTSPDKLILAAAAYLLSLFKSDNTEIN